jgi:hypothetical protein
MDSDFEDYNIKLQASILNPTKHAFALPTDIQFHKSIDRDFAEEIEACSKKVLSTTNRLLTLAMSSTTIIGGKGKARLLVDLDDVVDDFDSVVVDIMDQLMERVVSEPLDIVFRILVTAFQDCCLDTMQGLDRTPVISINPNTVETGVQVAKLSPGTLLTTSWILSDKTEYPTWAFGPRSSTRFPHHQTPTQIQSQTEKPERVSLVSLTETQVQCPSPSWIYSP